MAVSTKSSCALSLLLSVLLFSGMQMYRGWLASSQLHTILGGFLSSILFILILTGVGNLETALFGKMFQTKLFPEVILCLGIAVTAAGMIHRVCTTTCFLFSLIGLYYVNLISQRYYTTTVPPQTLPAKKKK